MMRLALFALAVSALAGCRTPDASAADAEPTSLPYYAEASFTPHWFASHDAVPDTFHTVPAFSLTDQDGRTVTEADVRGTVTVANFFFTSCPGICPMTMANMARLQTAFEGTGDVVLLSHSVTPERDGPDALRSYADQMQVVSSQWRLLTGTREAVYALGKDAYFADEDLGERAATDEDAAFTHTESFVLVDRDGHLRGVYNGMDRVAVDRLIDDARLLLAEDA